MTDWVISENYFSATNSLKVHDFSIKEQDINNISMT